jgi:prophage regulatory protein
MVINLLRLPPTLKKRGKSKSSHYLDINLRLFTKPVSIGARSVAWPEHEIDALNAARIAGFSDDEIRALVVELEAKRKTLANKVGIE